MAGPALALLYHRIGWPLVRSTVRGQYVAPCVLKWQMRSLHGLGYRPIHLNELLADPRAAESRFAVTFDDGYASVAETACPVLSELGVPATIFLVAGQIGGANLWDQAKGDREERLMTAEQIREWSAAGFEMGSHAMTHSRLTEVSDSQLKAEVSDSKHLLEDLIGARVRGFSYPHGAWDARVRDAVVAAGYEYATAVSLGSVRPDTDVFTIPRINMRWATVGAVLRRKILNACR